MDFAEAPLLLNNPPSISDLVVQNMKCSWSKLSQLARHFVIIGDYSIINDNTDVYDNLKNIVDFGIQGLRLLNWSPVDEMGDYDIEKTGKTADEGLHEYGINANNGSSGKEKSTIPYVDNAKEDAINILDDKTQNNTVLLPLPGMETIKTLVMHKGIMRENGDSSPPVIMTNLFEDNTSVPHVLQTHLWSELEHLELVVSYLDLDHILILNKTAPKLSYLKLYVPFDNIPEIVWTYDWDLLPWRTGFIAVYEPKILCTESLKLDMSSKIESKKIPPINFYDAGSRYYICLQNLELNLEVDFSQNELISMDHFQFTFGRDFNIHLNFSHNKLTSVELYDRYHVINALLDPKRDCGTAAKVRMLDLSFNQLNDTSSWTSDYILFTHLNVLYFHHNKFENLPFCTVWEGSKYYYYYIRDLIELRTLDLSHNKLKDPNYDRLIFDEFSTITQYSFHHNMLRSVPDLIYRTRYIRNADFSYNFITFSDMWPSQMKSQTRDLEQTRLLLDSNSITNFDISTFTYSEIQNVHKVLQNTDIHLRGNQINCSCASHRMYKYLISSSRSERPQEKLDGDNLPNFDFYKQEWNCTNPLQWTGTPIMQIPEYEYDLMCAHNLTNCSDGCYCYHSWNHGDAIVVNCSYGNTNQGNLTELPASVPDVTSFLILSHSNINSLCQSRSYLNDLKHVDLRANFLETICASILKELTNVRYLDLSNNRLTKLPLEIGDLVNLTSLDLSNNRLQVLPKTIRNLKHLTSLAISGNMFECNCVAYWMSVWLRKSPSIVTDPNSVLCFSGKGRGKRLVDINQDDVGCYDFIQNLAIGVGVAFPLTIILIFVIFRYRGYIKIWLYTRFGFHPWDQVKENPEEKDYDAFVSFCHKDLHWVAGTLLPYLEAPQCGYHLCVHERDFVPGVAITKNIMTAIQYSRRTILVLSPNFIKSGWCDLEFQAAHQRALEDRSNFLIVVLLEEVDQKDLDETLCLYMKTKTYVSADDKWLWEKLLYAMPKIPIDKLKAQQETNQGDAGNHQEACRQQQTLEQNEALMRSDSQEDYNDNSDSDSTESGSDSDSDNMRVVYKRPSRRSMVARLPPLFKRINTYNT